MAVASLVLQTQACSSRQLRNMAEPFRDAQHQVSSSEKDLVNTELGQEVPKLTIRVLLHHCGLFSTS